MNLFGNRLLNVFSDIVTVILKPVPFLDIATQKTWNTEKVSELTSGGDEANVFINHY